MVQARADTLVNSYRFLNHEKVMSTTMKKKFSTKRKSSIVYSLIVVILILSLLGVVVVFFPFISAPESFPVNATQDQVFTSRFAKNANVNNGLTLNILSSHNKPIDTEFGELAEYGVFNHTGEPIIFQNTSLGLQIFAPSGDSNFWEEVKPIIPYGNVPVTLMPNNKVIDSYNNVVDNTINLFYSDYDKNVPDKLRFYVTGVGKNSGMNYVAYFDLKLNR
jgi:hypothetical protein